MIWETSGNNAFLLSVKVLDRRSPHYYITKKKKRLFDLPVLSRSEPKHEIPYSLRYLFKALH